MPADLLNHPLIAERYFFPRPGDIPRPRWVDAGDCRLACFEYRPHAEGRTLVHFHGNGEVVADYLDGFPEALAAIGLNSFFAEYRGYGMSQGRPALGRMLDDVDVLLQATGEPPEKLILFGRSVGSLFALQGVARMPAVAGLILESAVADVAQRLLLRLDPGEIGASPDEFAAAIDRRLNQQRKIQNFRGATLVMHARHDSLVPVAHGECLYRWAGGDKQLRIFERGDHNDILFANQGEYLAEMAAFVNRLAAL